MRFTVLTALLFASSTLATPLGIRDIGAVNDVKVITQAVKNVSQGLDKLRGALNVIARAKLSAITAPEEQEIIHHAGEVTKAMNSGAIDIRSGPTANYVEAAGLMSEITSLQRMTADTSKAWVAAKTNIVKTGGKEEALRVLNDHQAAAGSFADALVSRMPNLAQGISRELKVPSVAAINTAINAYKRG